MIGWKTLQQILCINCPLHRVNHNLDRKVATLIQGELYWCCDLYHLPFLTDMSGMCDLAPSTSVYGWWGRNSSRLTAIGQCRLDDFPAGLHSIKYRRPPNWTYPDEVIFGVEIGLGSSNLFWKYVVFLFTLLCGFWVTLRKAYLVSTLPE